MALGPRVGPFRGLAPYAEEDESLLFGRDQERRALLDLMRDSPTPVLVTGEPGVGKTSLLCAGLIPAARKAGLVPIYLEAGSNWRRQFREALATIIGRPPSPDEDPIQLLAAQGKPMIICDHLEELLWLHDERIADMADLLAKLRGIDSARTVLAADLGTSHAIGRLSERLAHVPDQRTLTVERWDGDKASQVLEQAVLAGGGYMEAGLPEAIAREVCEPGPALPAQLQIVGHAAALAGVTRLKTFSRVGGAEVLSTTYVERLAKRAGAWRARRALAVIAEQPDPRARLTPDEIAERAGLPDGAALPLLGALAREGLVRPHVDLEPRRRSQSTSTVVPLSDGAQHAGAFSLMHPYLMQSVRDLCASVQRGRARAKLHLRQRIHGGKALRPHELTTIWRYLGETLVDREREKIRRSLRLWILIILGAFAVPFAVLGGLYLGNTTASYLHAARAIRGVQRVVVRAGRPSLDFSFGLSKRFGGVEIDSGIALASLPKKTADAVRKRAYAGAIAKAKPGAKLPRWLDALVGAMRPIRRGAWLLIAGDRARGEQVLLAAAKQAETRQRAARTLATLDGPSKATREALLLCVGDARPAVRRMAVREAKRLGAQGGLDVLGRALKDRDAQVRLEALVAVHELDRKAALSLLHERLRDIDTRVQTKALELLEAAAEKGPALAFRILERAARGPASALAPIADKLAALRQRLLREHPKVMAREIAAALGAETRGARRAELVRRLIAISGKLGASEVLPTASQLAKDKNPDVRAAAIALEARFAKEAEPMLERLQQHARDLRRGRARTAMRRAAAAGLGLLSGGDRKERVKTLKKLLTDWDSGVRGAAAASLLRLGFLGQREVVKVMKRRADIARAALRAVCSELEPNRRLATVVLSQAWSTKRAELRSQALRCARTLASASWRLSMWLADQAAVSKEPEVRRAAAEAVALALALKGRALGRLARVYLRDRDPATRVAVLRAISRRPPKHPGFIFPHVQRLVADEVPAVRAATAKVLVQTAPRKKLAVPLLEQLLRDKKRVVRREALAAIAMLDKPALAAPLDKTVAQFLASARTRDALRALEVAKQLDLRAPVEQAARHSETAVRAAAIALLAPHGERKKTLSVLESALRESERRLRLAAIEALAEQSARLGEVVANLIWRETRAEDPTERFRAFEAMAKLQGAARARAVTLLLEAARHRSEERRALAFRALGKLAAHDARAAQALVAGAVDPAIDVRNAAQAALAAHLARRTKPERLFSILVGARRNSLLRRMMVASLARTRKPEWLAKKVQSYDKNGSIATRAAAQLALALARRGAAPQPLIDWLYGW
ncbi:MAG: HEAT repeat domain-containing protein [Myxococcales bacterium]|nr:HEAT repeat domain-containing protein [Myxococcales bacterium]